MLLVVTIGLLASIHPALTVLALFAVPAATSGSGRAGAERRAEYRAAPFNRLARHPLDIGTAPGSGKQLRVTRNGEDVITRRRSAWEAGYAALVRTRWTSAWLYAAAWGIFGAAFAGAIAVVAIGFRSSPGSVLLVLAAGSSLARWSPSVPLRPRSQYKSPTLIPDGATRSPFRGPGIRYQSGISRTLAGAELYRMHVHTHLGRRFTIADPQHAPTRAAGSIIRLFLYDLEVRSLIKGASHHKPRIL